MGIHTHPARSGCNSISTDRRGSDADQTRLHRYEIRPGTRTIEAISGDLTPTAELRAAHGYVTVRVDRPELIDRILAND